MIDLLVKLCTIEPERELIDALAADGVKLKRVLSPDRKKVIDFVRENFSEGWASETEAAFANNPITCYVAVKDKKIVGFACYDATAKGYFGPTGVLDSERGKGIGKALLNQCLLAMWQDGYGYAIIGWTDEAVEFYKKAVNAIVIEDAAPGVYKRMIEVDR